MTENEAKTKRCPQRFGSSQPDCIGSACMAWRWLPAEHTKALADAMVRHAASCGPGNFRGRDDNLREIVLGNNRFARERGQPFVDFDAVEGYCGLAGAPQ